MTVLTLPLPPLANRYWRLGRGHLYRSSEATAYKQAVWATLRAARVQPLDGPVSVSLTVYRARKAGDLDNFAKVALDSLQGSAYHNDNQIVRLEASLGPVDKSNPRLEVEVLPA